MEVDIFDVEHGGCAAVVAPSGRLMMIDAGHNRTTGWRPSWWVPQRFSEIECQVISNFDEDHVTDLPNLVHVVPIRTWMMNWNVTAEWVRREKESKGGMGAGVGRAVATLDAIRTTPIVTNDWGPGCDVRWFCHPVTPTSDENYLSVVTFIHCGGIRIAFGGDLTSQGWGDFLGNSVFVRYLQATNIFVASHHGREDGYCCDVFDFCHPDIIIASDKSVEFETQVVDYSQHAGGIPWGSGDDRRYFLTTRKDGKLTITPRPNGGAHILAGG